MKPQFGTNTAVFVQFVRHQKGIVLATGVNCAKDKAKPDVVLGVAVAKD